MIKLRKLASIWLSVSVFVLSTFTAGASGELHGKFFLKDIVINGAKIVNYNLQYPFFLYEDTTYIPLTSDMGDICGFESRIDWDGRILEISKKESTLTNIRDNRFKTDAGSIYAWAEDGIDVYVCDGGLPALSGEDITASGGGAIRDAWRDERLWGMEHLDLGGKSVIIVNGVTYLPLRAFTNSECFGWDVYYDPNLGFCLSTNGGVAAKSFFSNVQASFNKGLASYIASKNKSLSVSKSQEMVFLFRRAAEVNNLDTKLLIAVTQKESNFNPSAKSSSGASVLMQIMPKTAEGMGLTQAQVMDAKTNIDYGAAYLRGQLDKFEGNIGLALSAYNQGPGNVSRGTYSRGYAEKVNGIVNDIDQYLAEGGYVAPEVKTTPKR
jgi:hypothetical protein